MTNNHEDSYEPSFITGAKDVLDKARVMLAARRKMAEENELQIARLMQMIAALKPIAEPESIPDQAEEGPKGLTAMVRTVLSRSQHPLTIKDIRKQLERDGLDTGKYKQFAATLKITINRMIGKEQVIPYQHSDGDVTYSWFLNGPESCAEVEAAARARIPAAGGGLRISGHQPSVQITEPLTPPQPSPNAVRKLIRDSQERRKKLLGHEGE